MQLVAVLMRMPAPAGVASAWHGAPVETSIQDEQPWTEEPHHAVAGREAGTAFRGLQAEHAGLRDGDGLALQPETPRVRKEASQRTPEAADDTHPKSRTASVSQAHAAQPERQLRRSVASNQKGALSPVCQ